MCVNMESAETLDFIKVNEQPLVCPLCASVGEQMCWSTVATTGCVHWCGISTASVGVSRPELRGEGSCSPTQQYARKRRASPACVATVYAGAHKRTHQRINKPKTQSINQKHSLDADVVMSHVHVRWLLNLFTSFLSPYMEAISPLCCWLLRTGGILFPLY